MSDKIIVSLTLSEATGTGTLHDLQRAVSTLVDAAKEAGTIPLVVYTTTVITLALIEKTLSDGSKVYDVEIEAAP